ncbi:hypothetical protein GCM10010156_06830 [Planobispora rosea]|nr:hypothetical protein GCM10010156_06830 [Planobispora rosea]
MREVVGAAQQAAREANGAHRVTHGQAEVSGVREVVGAAQQAAREANGAHRVTHGQAEVSG